MEEMELREMESLISEPEETQVVTAKEAAEYLRVSEMTVLRLAQKGVLNGVKIGRQWRFLRGAVEELLRNPEIMKRPYL